MLNRSDLCKLAGISIERFKYLARHEKLQMITGYESPDDLSQYTGAESRGWRKYSAEDVVQLALFGEATERGGLSFDDARYAIGNAFIKLRELGNKIQSKRPADDIWIAAAIHVDGSKSTFAGTLSQLKRVITENDLKARRDLLSPEISQVWSMNASVEFRKILRRGSLDRGDLLTRFLDEFRNSLVTGVK